MASEEEHEKDGSRRPRNDPLSHSESTVSEMGKPVDCLSTALAPVYTDFLYTWWAESPNADPGLFIARAVINYGYLKNIKFMNVAHERFKKQCESGPRVQAHEVYEFVELLVHTLGKADAGDKFMKLYGHYQECRSHCARNHSKHSTSVAYTT